MFESVQSIFLFQKGTRVTLETTVYSYYVKHLKFVLHMNQKYECAHTHARVVKQ